MNSIQPAAADLPYAVADRLLACDPVIAAAGPAAASLSRGLAGTALLHARLSAIDQRFEAAAALHWTRAAQISSTGPSRAGGIFNGAGALATSLILGTPYLPEPGRHRDSARRGCRWLAARAAVVADWLAGRRRRREAGTPWQAYDLINGLSGLGMILLAAVQDGHCDAEPGLHAARTCLAEMIQTPDRERPGWWRPAPRHPAALTDPHNHDAANTGLAHGIAGPLAFLSACQTAGYGGTGQARAIGTAARWLLTWREADTWPPQVTAEDLAGTATTPSTRGRRYAWCYGSPGIGVALIAAGAALSDHALTHAGRHAIDALAGRADWDTEGPALCHGSAGILLCAHAAGSPDTAARATADLLSHYDPALPFCFGPGGLPGAEPGLLTGAAGIALTLAEHAGFPAPAVPAGWSAALLAPLALPGHHLAAR
jgi:hypothetical protein